MSNIPQNGVVILNGIPNSIQEVMVNRVENAYKNTDALAKQIAANTKTVNDNTQIVLTKAAETKTSEDNARNHMLQAEQYKKEAFNTTPSGYENLLQRVVWFDDNGILNIGGLA